MILCLFLYLCHHTAVLHISMPQAPPALNIKNKKMKRNPLLNFRILCYAIGSLLLLEAAFMVVPLVVSVACGESHAMTTGWISGFAACLAVGLCAMLPFRRSHGEWGRREGYLVVASVWVWYSLFSAVALRAGGAVGCFTDAFFESMAGFTTAGASIVPDVEALPRSVLLWRSLMQWIGGMGIIVLSLVFGFGGIQLYVAEVSGPVKMKMSPRLRQTAAMLWGHYSVFTVVVLVLLWWGGMDVFDAVCHTLSTVSTGGFSTHNDSLGHWDSPFIHYVVAGAMIFSALNFSVTYFLFHGKWRQSLRDEESRSFLFFVAFFAVACVAGNLVSEEFPTVESTVRHSLFMAVSTLTGTGYTTCGIMQWSPVLWMLLLVAMLVGGSSGSTTGGLKVVRVSILIKNSYEEFKRLLHPRAVIPLKFGGKVMEPETINNVLAYVFLYLALALAATLLLVAMGVGPMEAAGCCVSMLGDVGLGFGSVESGCFHIFAPEVKWVLCALMLLGRLEIFTVLFVFTPAFWKR